jgi:hypothetical protein
MAQSQYSTSGLLPAGVLQPYGENILKYGIGQLGRPIDVGALTGKVAGPSAFQQKAAQQMASMYGMGDIQRDATGMVTGFKDATGVASYQPYVDQISQQKLLDPTGYQQFMSPYQKEIIDTTMQEYDIQAGKGRQAISDQAYQAGAFGGGRHGIQAAEYQSSSDRDRAALLAGLYGQGYQQALGQQQQQLGNLQTMAGFVPGLQQQQYQDMATIGAEEQALEQQKLNQLATAAQTAYQLPMTRLTDVANIYGSVSGAMPGSPTQPFTQSPVATGIGSFFGMQNMMKGVKPGAQA